VADQRSVLLHCTVPETIGKGIYDCLLHLLLDPRFPNGLQGMPGRDKLFIHWRWLAGNVWFGGLPTPVLPGEGEA
jgi:hypothetical protein